MDTTLVWVLFGAFLLLLLIGAPITVSLGVSALAAFMFLEENPIKLVQIAFGVFNSRTPFQAERAHGRA